MSLSPFPQLSSERLLLRRLLPTDAETIFLLRSSESVNQFLNRPRQDKLQQARDFIEFINKGIDDGNFLYWSICLKATSEMIGTICLWNFNEPRTCAELGYEMRPDFQGCGYMSEALATLLKFVSEQIQLWQVEAFTHRENMASIQLLKKHGFTWRPERTDDAVPNNVIYVKDHLF